MQLTDSHFFGFCLFVLLYPITLGILNIKTEQAFRPLIIYIYTIDWLFVYAFVCFKLGSTWNTICQQTYALYARWFVEEMYKGLLCKYF